MQFYFRRYEGLTPLTKNDRYRGCFPQNLLNFQESCLCEQLWKTQKKKTKIRRKATNDWRPVTKGFLTFLGSIKMEHCSVSAFHYFHWSHKTTSFLLKFSHNTASQFRYVIYFYDRDWQSSFHFSEFAGVHIGLLLGRQLKYCMKIFYKSTELHANVKMSVIQSHHIGDVTKSI